MGDGVTRKGGISKGSTAAFWSVLGLAAAILGVYLLKAGSVGRTGAGPEAASTRAPAPAGVLQRYDQPEQTVALAALRGKVVVLHFWATWCPPCRAEFPEFARYATSESADREVAILPVSLDQTPKPVGPFLSSARAGFPVYMDGAGLADALGVTAIPTTIVLDRQGRVAYRNEGAADWSAGGVPAVVKALGRE